MSLLEMKVPSPGESISEVEIAAWLVSEGDYVEKDQAIAEVDSDKATLELPAEESGTIQFKAEEGDVVEVGQVVCIIDTSAEAPKRTEPIVSKEEAPQPKNEVIKETPADTPSKKPGYAEGTPSPAAAKIMAENKVVSEQISGSGKDGRILKSDVLEALSKGIEMPTQKGWSSSRETSRERMSMLRRKIAQRLVAVKNETAMLTTFNEIDMKPIMDLRKKYKDEFR